MNKILFVCLGNICRSPLAKAIADNLIKTNSLDILASSAGTGDWHIGQGACANSQKIAQIKGLDISWHKARQICKDDFSKYDTIVGLDGKNIKSLKELGYKNPLLLGDFGLDGADIADPYFFDGFDGFEMVFDQIELCVKNLLGSK